MKPLMMILATCAMATTACGSSAMPDPHDPSTKISASAAPPPEKLVEPRAEAAVAQTEGAPELGTATSTSSK